MTELPGNQMAENRALTGADSDVGRLGSCSATLLQLAALAGATDESGGSVNRGAVCFTHTEFQGFVIRLLAHQQQLLEVRRPGTSLRNEFDYLAEKLGIKVR